jgi:AcrR family transcriptional regulator
VPPEGLSLVRDAGVLAALRSSVLIQQEVDLPRDLSRARVSEPVDVAIQPIDVQSQPADASPPSPVRVPRRSRNHERTRETILASALHLYSRAGYAAVSMRVVAHDLGFSAPSLYNYFLSKEEIFDTLRDRGLSRFEALALSPGAEDPLEDLKLFFQRYYSFSLTERTYFTLLWVDPITADITATGSRFTKVLNETVKKVARCIETGVFPQGTNPASVMYLLWTAVHGPAVLANMKGSDGFMDLESLSELAIDIVIGAARRGGVSTDMRQRKTF